MSETPAQEDGGRVSRYHVDLTGVALLGHYRVERKLTEGGMGAVYLAEDTNLGRHVVVKVPHPRFLGDAEFRERLAREIEELIRLEHPHIVRILARGEHEDLPFFVLQYLGGGSLEDRLAREPGRRMAAPACLPWLETMARTLDFVHERGVVHRDVKPANVLFDEDGHVYLSDFGVAKTLQGKDAALTGTGVSIGSPTYMAPEQGAGKAVGPAADLYALASTVYEALAGRPPFEGDQVVELLVRKMREDPLPLAPLAPDVGAEAGEAVMRALAREPEARYASCTAFADAFRAGLGEAAPLPAPPRTVAAAVRPRVPTGRRLAIAGALVLAALLFLVLRGHQSRPAPPGGASGDARAPSAEVDGGEDVVLVEAGRAPRRKLRYFVGEGARERLRMVASASVGVIQDGAEQPSRPLPAMALESDVRIDDVTTEGGYRLQWDITACDVVEGAEEAAASELSATLGLLVGVSATARGDARGRIREVHVDVDTERSPILAHVTEGFADGLAQMLVPLPEEPVGVGARWEVTRLTEHMGMRVTETMTYEAVAFEGYEVRIRHARALTAPPQDVEPPGVPEGAEVRVRSFHVAGSGEIVVDLSRAVPIRSVTEVELRMAADQTYRGRQSHLELTNTVRNELTRR